MAPSLATFDRRAPLFVGPFQVEYAIGVADRLAEYRLRYRVFVEERKWLKAGPSPDRLERDEFDDTCGALLLRDSRTDQPVGCQRFILPERLPSGLVTSVERVGRGLGVRLDLLRRDSWAEASRLTIAPEYRWGGAATSLPAMVAIHCASVALAVALGRTALFSLSDLRTARLTRRLGFTLHQIGAAVDFHGQRAPFRMDVAELVQSVPSALRDSLHRLIAGAHEVLAARG